MYLRIPLVNYNEDETDGGKKERKVFGLKMATEKKQLIKPFETKACFRLIVSKLQT